MSSTRPSLGLVLPTFPQTGDRLPTFAELGAVASGAEDAGATRLWCCDHLFWPGPSVEALTAATVALDHTERCSVGTGVLQLPLRRPAEVAKAVASLAALSGDRFVLGLGVGSHPGEYERAGIPFATRGRAMDTAITELLATWKASADDYAQRPAPGDVPLWFGGTGTAARRRVAQFGAGWLPLLLTVEDYGQERARLDEALNRLHRDRSRVDTGVVVFASVGEESSRADALDWMASLLSVPADRLDRHLLHGSPSTVAEGLAAYGAAGAGHVAVLVPSDEPLPAFTALAEAFRRRWP